MTISWPYPHDKDWHPLAPRSRLTLIILFSNNYVITLCPSLVWLGERPFDVITICWLWLLYLENTDMCCRQLQNLQNGSNRTNSWFYFLSLSQTVFASQHIKTTWDCIIWTEVESKHEEKCLIGWGRNLEREGGERILHCENTFVTRGGLLVWGRRLIIFRRSNKEMHVVGHWGWVTW